MTIGQARSPTAAERGRHHNALMPSNNRPEHEQRDPSPSPLRTPPGHSPGDCGEIRWTQRLGRENARTNGRPFAASRSKAKRCGSRCAAPPEIRPDPRASQRRGRARVPLCEAPLGSRPSVLEPGRPSPSSDRRPNPWYSASGVHKEKPRPMMCSVLTMESRSAFRSQHEQELRQPR